jgi:hypothetical protein
VSNIQQTIASREATHGAYAVRTQVSMSISCQLIWGLFKSDPERTHNSDEIAPILEAFHMIAIKLSRAACGDPFEADTWHDIAGYATLAEECCKLGAPTRPPEVTP